MPGTEDDFSPPTFSKRSIRYRWQTLVNENGVVPGGAVERAVAQARNRTKAGGISTPQWTPIGPANFPCWIWTLSIDPRNGKMLVAGAAGGIWSSTDGGTTWLPNPDDTLAHSSIGAIARDPTNPDVLYAGAINYLFPGRGLLKSTDAGATWQVVPSTVPTFSFTFNTWMWLSVNAVAVHPSNGNIVFAANDEGIQKSTNAGASWTRVSTVIAKDIRFDPANAQNLLAGGNSGDVFTSTDGGNTWTRRFIAGASGRAIVSYVPTVSGRAYASTEDNSGSLYRSNDGGQTWALAANPQHHTDFTHNVLWVDPGNANNLVLGGMDLYRSTDAGATFTQVSTWQLFPVSPHADQHAIAPANGFSTASNRAVYWGNDGGLYRAADYLALGSTSGWTWLPHGQSTMFYSGAGRRDSSGKLVVMGGTQDHGTIISKGTGTTWSFVIGGDGGAVAFDNANPDNVIYSTYVMAGMQRSAGSPATLTYICQTLGDAQVAGQCNGTGKTNFLAPWVQDPNRARLVVGANSLWATDDPLSSSPTWRAIKAPSTGLYFGTATNYISAVAVATGDSNRIWAGHNNGELYYTVNGLAATPSWTQVPGLPARMVRRILVDPASPATVYVTFGGYSSGNVWRTRDGGATWQDISSNLPQAPVHTLVRNPSFPDRLYVGTEVGIFASDNGGGAWSTSNDGPGAYSVQELFWIDATTLGAASFGRGMWTAKVGSARFSNISTRMQVLTGNDVMIAGFVIGGSASKRVVVNVAGPNLANFGITNALADPRLTLVRSSDQAVLASNDDWQSQANPPDVAAITAAGLQPNNPKEPAIIATLAPGAYTAIVDGVGNTTGVGLVGVFEVDHPEVPLANISTRGQVLTGNDVMIAGFVVSGDAPKTMVVNVAGPSLASFGITNALANPTLTVVRSSDQSVIASNDDWQSQANPADVAAIQATGFQPNHPKEPALLLTLQPGAYTAIVQGAGATTGVGLVGVFALP